MSDEEEELPARGVREVLNAPRRWKKPLGRPASWVLETADRLVVRRVEGELMRLVESLTEPENALRLQSALAHVAQLGMEIGFRSDPDAKLLFELVAWLEERHGRPPVLREVAQHMASTETTLLRALGSILGDLTEPGSPIAREEVARGMHEMRDEAAGDLLDLLCGLAALESGGEPPGGTVEARVAFYEEAELPEEFRMLAAMAAGIPGAFDAPQRKTEASLVRRLRGKLWDEDPGQIAASRGLARFVPSLDDPHLRFLTLSHLFFLQSYLTRNLVEALPELLDLARLDAIADSSS